MLPYWDFPCGEIIPKMGEAVVLFITVYYAHDWLVLGQAMVAEDGTSSSIVDARADIGDLAEKLGLN